MKADQGRGLLATMLKVEVGKGRFYVSRHDAKPSLIVALAAAMLTSKRPQ